jgi:hypothetical protein
MSVFSIELLIKFNITTTKENFKTKLHFSTILLKAKVVSQGCFLQNSRDQNVLQKGYVRHNDAGFSHYIHFLSIYLRHVSVIK